MTDDAVEDPVYSSLRISSHGHIIDQIRMAGFRRGDPHRPLCLVLADADLEALIEFIGTGRVTWVRFPDGSLGLPIIGSLPDTFVTAQRLRK